MKKLLTILTLFAATIGVTAQNCSQGRYVDEIFPTISTTSDNDALTDRALIIMAHEVL